MIFWLACNSPIPAASAGRTTSISNRASPTIIRCWTPSSASIPTTLMSSGPTTIWSGWWIATSRRLGLAQRRRLSICRYQGLPRLSIARIFERSLASRPVRRRSGRPRAGVDHRWSAAFATSCPHLLVGVRLSVFDMVPFQAGAESGRADAVRTTLAVRVGFGVDPGNPLEFDLAEPLEFLKMLHDLGVAAVNLSCGSPYYNPHIQRPAIFPPSDGYQPPEDPLVGVARQIQAVRQCKQALPDLPLVGTGYSICKITCRMSPKPSIRAGWTDFVGLGRMVFSYPELPADVLADGQLTRKKVCRTFSDCTTAPRNGLISGCFPLDPYYKSLPEAERLKALKEA